jgi:hypothetical protein
LIDFSTFSAFLHPPFTTCRGGCAAIEPERAFGHGSNAGQVSWRLVDNEDNRTWVCRGEGSAVFLDGNRFLTAAHTGH